MKEKEKQKFRTITITEDAFDALDFLSIKSKATKSEIVSSWLEQVAKVVYPLEFGSHINYMFSVSNSGDKVVCYFGAMTLEKHSDFSALSEKTNEILDEKLERLSCDELASRIAKAKSETKKKSGRA
jgi:hypothetical protein